MLYVIFALYNADIVLFREGFGKHIDIARIRAYYPHARNIVYVFLYAVYRYSNALARGLFNNAVQRLQPRFNAFYRVAVILQRKFFVKHVELGRHLHHGAAVIGHKFPVWPRIILHPCSYVALAQARK